MLKRGYRCSRSLLAFARRAGAGRGGAVAVEMTFVAPILILMLLFIIHFAISFSVQHSLNAAAREAARRLAVGEVNVGVAPFSSCPGDDGSARRVACNNLSEWEGMTFLVAACDPDIPYPTLCPFASDVAVQIRVPRSQVGLAGMLGLFDDGYLQARSTMRQE